MEVTSNHSRESRLAGRSSASAVLAVATAAKDVTPVSGLTHDFYRYPARFSPTFAAEAIKQFSRVGDLVLDPYMGGGTVAVECARIGRNFIGNDINALSHFLATVKTTPLTRNESLEALEWAIEEVPSLRVRNECAITDALLGSERTKNLSIPRARYLKRIIAAALASISSLSGERLQNFLRCAVLNTSQWALDGRRCATSTDEFRQRLQLNTQRMLLAIDELRDAMSIAPKSTISLCNVDAADLASLSVFADERRAQLVVTSPPYPGVHVLYHRWQVDGRRESPAPYWIANRADGQGASYYAFASRTNLDGYFSASLRTLMATRSVMDAGAIMVQLIAFSEPRRQLARYLATMEEAGFREIRETRNRAWRGVPNRKWHAAAQGHTSSAREVMLVHEAV